MPSRVDDRVFELDVPTLAGHLANRPAGFERENRIRVNAGVVVGIDVAGVTTRAVVHLEIDWRVDARL